MAKKAVTPQDQEKQDPSDAKVENKGVVTKVEGQEETPEGQESRAQQETGDGAEYDKSQGDVQRAGGKYEKADTSLPETDDDDPGVDDDPGADDEDDSISNVILNEKETIARKLEKIRDYKDSDGYDDLDDHQKSHLNDLEHAYRELETALGLIGTKEFKGSVIGKTQPKANPALPEFHL